MMASLRLCPAALRPRPPSNSTRSARISSSLRPRPFPLRRHRFCSLVISLPRGRLTRGGSAAGFTMVETAASSYACALAEVAKANDTLDATLADLEKVESIFSDPAVQSFFTNPTISDEEKTEIINEVGSHSALQPHTVSFLNVLVDMKRIDLIKEIVSEFEDQCNRLTGTELALVSSVVNLESQHLAQIAKTVQALTGASKVRIKTAIDPSLIAGFTIRYGSSGSKLIDMSVKHQLDEIAAQVDFSSIDLS